MTGAWQEPLVSHRQVSELCAKAHMYDIGEAGIAHPRRRKKYQPHAPFHHLKWDSKTVSAPYAFAQT